MSPARAVIPLVFLSLTVLVIFKNTTAQESQLAGYSCSIHHQPYASFGIGYDTPTNALLSELSTMPGIKWTRAMELVPLDLMVDSVRKGLRAESGFKKTAWIEALRMTMTEFSLLSELTIKQLTTKFQGYKTKWKEWLIIDNVLGWGWDPVKVLYTADNATWDAHLIVC